MRNKIGIMLMILGAALVLGALFLFIYNVQEESAADEYSSEILPQIIETIKSNSKIPEGVYKMAEVEIDGHAYIGYISIPAIELELPVMSDWSYSKLKISPCRYSGTLLGNDLVLVAHNYKRHFRKISTLSEGDKVIFLDVNGNATEYEVAAIEVLLPTAVDDMISGEYDLTLFTCTYGGRSRVTVRCEKVYN